MHSRHNFSDERLEVEDLLGPLTHSQFLIVSCDDPDRPSSRNMQPSARSGVSAARPLYRLVFPQ